MIPQLSRFLANRNRWIGAIFLCYLTLIFTFAAIYFFIFQGNREAFAFNSNIIRSQIRAVEQRSSKKLQQLGTELNHLTTLEQLLASAEPDLIVANDGLSITITGANAKYTFVRHKPGGGGPVAKRPPPPHLKVVSIADAEGAALKIVGKDYGPFPQTKAEFRVLCDAWIADSLSAIEQTQAVIKSLQSDRPDIWSYWDFLYFSAITQFSVGYGDILPNSTAIRLIVTSQTCLSALLVVVLITAALASTDPERILVK